MVSPLPQKGQGSNEGGTSLGGLFCSSSKSSCLCPVGSSPVEDRLATAMPLPPSLASKAWGEGAGRGPGSEKARPVRTGEKFSGFSPALLSAPRGSGLALPHPFFPSYSPPPPPPLSPLLCVLPLSSSESLLVLSFLSCVCVSLPLCPGRSLTFTFLGFLLCRFFPSLFSSLPPLLPPPRPSLPLTFQHCPATDPAVLQASPQAVPPAPQPAPPPPVPPQALTIPVQPLHAPHFLPVSLQRQASVQHRMSELQCEGPDMG